MDDREPCYDKAWLRDHTPSRAAGISVEDEEQLRSLGCRLIADIAPPLQTPRWVANTAQLYLHRYYCTESIKAADVYIMAMAAYFVACKVEECLRPLDHITREAWKRYVQYNADLGEEQKAMEYGAFEGESGSSALKDNITEAVLAGERAIFYAFGFTLPQFRAYHIMTEERAKLPQIKAPAGDAATKIAWDLVDPMMHTTMCLTYTQHEIAWGLVCLAARMTGSTALLFVDDETPLWADHGVPNFERLQAVMDDALEVLQKLAQQAQLTKRQFQEAAALPKRGSEVKLEDAKPAQASA